MQSRVDVNPHEVLVSDPTETSQYQAVPGGIHGGFHISVLTIPKRPVLWTSQESALHFLPLAYFTEPTSPRPDSGALTAQMLREIICIPASERRDETFFFSEHVTRMCDVNLCNLPALEFLTASVCMLAKPQHMWPWLLLPHLVLSHSHPTVTYRLDYLPTSPSPYLRNPSSSKSPSFSVCF
jgi:hypothetical protein